MTAARRVTAVIAATLPWGVRERYREEWLADLEGAAELGIPAGSVVRGAAVTALTLDRADPATSGMPRTDLARRRARWAAALGSGAVVLGIGLFLTGGPGSPVPQRLPGGAALAVVGVGLQIVAMVLGALAVVFALGSLTAGGVRVRPGIGLAFVVLGVAAVVAVALVSPLTIAMLGVPFAGYFALIAVSRGTQPPAPPRVRAAWGAAIFVATLAFVGMRVVQITVWNPLARAPGMSLDQIYGEMSAANQLSPAAGAFVAGWAAVWITLALGLLIVCLIPAAGRWLTVRRLVVTGCAMLGVSTVTSWIAGFGIGMALADTFMTSGGDGTVVGAALTTLGQIALAAALIIGLAPSRPPAPQLVALD